MAGKGKGIELATAYVSVLGETSQLSKDIAKAFDGADRTAGNAGKSMGAKLADGFGRTAKPGKALDAFQSDAERRGEKIGTAIGTVLGKGIGGAIKLGIGGAALGATAAVGTLTASLAKGFTRLKNIDDAKFKLQALGNSVADVDMIMKSALASVKGTAFSMDEAATAAASAVAAGIQPGQDLTRYLKGVADAAAVAGTGFTDMGAIFNKIQTSNKAFTDDLRQLSDRGLPIFQWLQKQYGVTAEELTKMVEKGQVDAAAFQKAIEDNISGAALKMGQSFSGAVDNANAALGRLGAALLAPGFSQASGGVTAITTALDGMTKWVDAHQDEIIGFWASLGRGATSAAQDVLRSVAAWGDAVGDLWNAIGDTLGGITKAHAWAQRFVGRTEFADQLDREAESLFGWGDAFDKVAAGARTAIDSLERGRGAITAWEDGTKAAATLTKAFGDAIAEIPDGKTITLTDNTPEVTEKLDALGVKVTSLPDGKVTLTPNTPEAQRLIDAFIAKNNPTPPVNTPVQVDTAKAAADLKAFIEGAGGSVKVAVQLQTGSAGNVSPNPPAGLGFLPYDPSKSTIGGGRASGGEIYGPGPKGRDSVLMWGAPGEHMLTDDDVDALGGQGGVYAFRKALHNGGIPGFEGGGAIGAIDYAYNNSGKPYQYGPFDCSMYMSQIYARMAGKPPGRYFTTDSDFAALGFKKGFKAGALNIGTNGGSGTGGHMAGTLPNGVNVENSSGGGSIYGPGAQGAQDFSGQWYYEPPTNAELLVSAVEGTPHGAMMGAPPGPADTSTPGASGATGARTEGYIPSGAGSTTVAGTSFASGLLNMGAEAVNSIIDQAGSAAGMAASAAIAGGSMGAGAAGGSQAGAAAAQFAIGIGTNAAKRGVSYGFQMAGIGIDALTEQLFPIGGPPRLLGYDYAQFVPHLNPTAVTGGEQDAQSAGAVQPGQLPGAAQSLMPPQPAPFGTQTPQPPGSPALPPEDDWLKRLNADVFDSGGVLADQGVALNLSGQPEHVLTGPQWDSVYKAATAYQTPPPDPEMMGGHRTIIENVTVKDVAELRRELDDRDALATMRYRGRPTPG